MRESIKLLNDNLDPCKPYEKVERDLSSLHSRSQSDFDYTYDINGVLERMKTRNAAKND